MSKFIHWISAFLITVSVVNGAWAQIDPMDEGTGALNTDQIKEWRFQEDIYEIPDYPDMDKLMPVQIDAPISNFKYFIDQQALSIGADDIVRFTIVIRATSGYNNVLNEAIRCDTQEYKTIAYGASNHTFYEVDHSQWKPIGFQTATGLNYRKDLATNYFCDLYHVTLDRGKILHRIQYPQDIPQHP